MQQIKTILIILLLGHAVLSNPQTMPKPMQGFVKEIANFMGENSTANAGNPQNLRNRVNQIMYKDVASLTPEEQGLRNTVLSLNAVAQSQGVDAGTINGLISRSISKVSQQQNAFRVAANNPVTMPAAPQHWYW